MFFFVFLPINFVFFSNKKDIPTQNKKKKQNTQMIVHSSKGRDLSDHEAVSVQIRPPLIPLSLSFCTYNVHLLHQFLPARFKSADGRTSEQIQTLVTDIVSFLLGLDADVYFVQELFDVNANLMFTKRMSNAGFVSSSQLSLAYLSDFSSYSTLRHGGKATFCRANKLCVLHSCEHVFHAKNVFSADALVKKGILHSEVQILNSTKIHLLNVHLQSDDDCSGLKQLSEIRLFIEQLPHEEIAILAGDFNLDHDSQLLQRCLPPALFFPFHNSPFHSRKTFSAANEHNENKSVLEMNCDYFIMFPSRTQQRTQQREIEQFGLNLELFFFCFFVCLILCFYYRCRKRCNAKKISTPLY